MNEKTKTPKNTNIGNPIKMENLKITKKREDEYDSQVT